MMTIDFVKTGSKGNSTIFKTGDTTIAIDLGLTLKLYKEVLKDIPTVDVVLITHGHSDHIKGLETFYKRNQDALYVCHPQAYQKYEQLQLPTSVVLDVNSKLCVKDVIITPFSTRHDTPGCVGYSIINRHTQEKFTYVTDTGALTRNIREHIKDADVLFLESDYDEYHLEKSEKYDEALKERIAGPYGHLSNQQVISFLQNFDTSKLKHIVLGHLSDETNSPSILRERLEVATPDLLDKILISYFPVHIDV